MKSFERFGYDFAVALVDGRWDDARRFLSADLQSEYSAQELRDVFTGMYSGYAEGPVREATFDPEFSMEEWPAKQDGDVGWLYVGLLGANFVEALTLTVAATPAGLVVRNIEWGRP